VFLSFQYISNTL